MNRFINKRFASLDEIADKFCEEYKSADPFPSIGIKDFFDPDMLNEVLDEFPDLSKKDAIVYNVPKEIKFAGKGEKDFGPKTKQFMHFLNSEPFLKFLQKITGIKEVIMGDPYFDGGGLHEIKRGGLLKIHADFNKHPVTRLDRRINVLVYLNKDWKQEYGGHFQLWDKEMKKCVNKISPEFNTLAMFSTTSDSFHGHPDPLECPEDRSRKSLALYYYTNGRPASEIVSGNEEHTTLFRARKDNEIDQSDFSKRSGGEFKRFIKDFVPPIFVRLYRKVKS